MALVESRNTTDNNLDTSFQALGGLSLTYLIIIISVYSVVVLTCLCFANLRYRKRKRILRHIPRAHMPIRPGEISQKQRSVVLDQLSRSKENATKVEPVVNLSTGYFGYGSSETVDTDDKQTIHFKSAIASSSWILELVATRTQPKLKRRPTMNLRDYVLYLQKNFPQLDRDLCQFYIATYERSRFSNDEFTVEEYTQFMERFHHLLKQFKQ